MSTPWTETLYPYGAPVGIAPGSAITSDLQISKNNPGVEYIGSEANAIYQETREIAGDFWFAQNASYAASGSVGQWKQTNAAQSSYALVIRADGTVQRYSAGPGAANPIVWAAATLAVNTGLSAVGITSTAGVAVGGALTGATTGAFSGAVSAAGLTSSATITVSGGGVNITAGGINVGGTATVYGSNISGLLALGANGLNTLDYGNTTAGRFTFTNGDVAAPNFRGGFIGGAISGTTITGTGLGTFVGVAVGGALTGATTGAFSGAITLGTPLAIAYGGTGSATQNFVDLTTAQTIAGIKTFSSAPVMSGASISATTIPNGALVSSTISGVALGGTLFAHTAGTHLSGSTYTGAAAVTWTTDATNLNTASTIVSRAGDGSFSSGPHTMADTADGTKQATFAMSTIATGTTRTFTFPNVSGTFITSGDTGTVTNTMLAGSIAQSKLAAFAGVAVGGPLSTVTTAGVSGTITSTFDGKVFDSTGSTTGFNYQRFSNTGNTTLFGIESSVGANLLIGSSAYATVLGTASARSLQLGTNNNVRLTLDSSGNATFTGTVASGAITSTGLGTFVGLAAGGAISGATTIGMTGALSGGTTANFSGLGTFVGLSAGTGTVQGSSNASTTAYVPPVYTAAGAAVASTTHCVFGTAAGTGTNVTITLSGAAAYASGNFVVLAMDLNSSGPVTIVSQNSTSFTLGGITNGHTYTYFVFGV